MQTLIDTFLQRMENEKKSKNTCYSYAEDLKHFSQFCHTQNVTDVTRMTSVFLNSYILKLEQEGKKPSTIARMISSLKYFFRYLEQEQIIQKNDAELIKKPRIKKQLPEILSFEETMRLLEQPAGTSPKELRDKAMMELLYETGIHISDLISLQVSDVNLDMDYLTCCMRETPQIIPFGMEAKKALEQYLKNGRDFYCAYSDSKILFLNYKGKPMSRQGFWKLIKAYGQKAEIEVELTPHMLCHSFAVHLMTQGIDLNTIQETLGYENAATAQMYARMKHIRVRRKYKKKEKQ